MLKLGSSKPWPEAMKLMTGGEKMDASGIMEYFKPLLEYLKKENGDDFGWDPKCPSLESPKPSCSKCPACPSHSTNNNSASVPSLTFTQIMAVLVCLLFSFSIQV